LSGATAASPKLTPKAQDTRDIVFACLVSLYSVILLSLSAYALLSVWPTTPADFNSTSARNVTIYLIVMTKHYSIGPETMLVLAMVLAGVIGACSYNLYATTLHVAYGDFGGRWSLFYLVRPFLGAGFALMVYFLIRGGVMTVSSDLSSTNLAGVSGIAGLVGLFAEQVFRKFNDLADTLFGKGPGLATGAQAEKLTLSASATNGTTVALTVSNQGQGAVTITQVLFGQVPLTAANISGTLAKIAANSDSKLTLTVSGSSKSTYGITVVTATGSVFSTTLTLP